MADLLFEAHADLHHFSSALVVSCLLICKTQIPGCICLSPPVSDLVGDDELLIIVIDGLTGVAKSDIGQAQVAQIGSLTPLIPDLAGDDEPLLLVIDGLPVVPKGGVGIAPLLSPGIWQAEESDYDIGTEGRWTRLLQIIFILDGPFLF